MISDKRIYMSGTSELFVLAILEKLAGVYREIREIREGLDERVHDNRQ